LQHFAADFGGHARNYPARSSERVTPWMSKSSDRMTDLFTAHKIDSKSLTLKPYQYTWLTTEDS
jgi:hypothetical protein